MGYVLTICASLLFGIYPSIQDAMMMNGSSPLGAVIVCLGLAGAFSLFAALVKHETIRVPLRTFGAFLVAGVAGLFLTNYLLAVAYTLIPVGFATMIHFMFPTVVCLATSLFFKEGFTLFKLAGGDFSGDRMGILVAGCTAFTYALYMTSNEKTSIAAVSPWTRVAYVNILSAVAGLFLNLFTHEAAFPTDAFNWGLGVLLGITLLLGFAFLNMGIDRLGAARASFINMVEPITSLIVSGLAFHYAIQTQSLLGCCLIMGAMLLVAFDGRTKKDETSTEASS